MENIIITTVTSIVAAIVTSFLTSIFTFRFWQIKIKVELLNKLNNACLKLDSAFQEYLKLDSLLGPVIMEWIVMVIVILKINY